MLHQIYGICARLWLLVICKQVLRILSKAQLNSVHFMNNCENCRDTMPGVLFHTHQICIIKAEYIITWKYSVVI